MTKLQLSFLSALLFSIPVHSMQIENEVIYSSASNIEKTSQTLELLERENTKLFYGAWNAPITVTPFTFFTSNRNISLDQIPYPKIELASQQIYDNGLVFDIDMPQLKKEYDLANNERRLKQGRSPLGPDGQPLVLCALALDSEASYVEMSTTQWNKAISILGIDPDDSDDYCLSERMSSKYWKERLLQLVDGSNHAKKSQSIKPRS